MLRFQGVNKPFPARPQIKPGGPLSRRNIRRCSLLKLNGLDTAADVDRLAEDCCKQLHAACRAREQGAAAAAALQQLTALTYVLDFIQTCHPNSSWQAAAQAALLQLNSTALYLQCTTANHTAGATAAAAAATGNEACQGSNSNARSDAEQTPNSSAAPSHDQLLQQLLYAAGQQEAWTSELHSLQAATAAASAATQFDPVYAPALLLDAAAVQQHPIWRKDYAAFAVISSLQEQEEGVADISKQLPTDAGSPSGVAPWQQQQQLRALQLLPIELPSVSVLHVGSGASLDIEGHYAAAAALFNAAAAPLFEQAAASAKSADSSSVMSSSSGSSGSKQPQDSTSSPGSGCTTPGPVMPWHLTAPNTHLLLCSPLGLLPEAAVGQVYHLGLLARCGVLCDAVDLSRLVAAELQAAQAEQQQLGQQLIQQMDKLHSAAQGGSSPGDPVKFAAAASAAAAMGCGPAAAAAVSSSCRQPGVHPAVTAAFLRELAAFGKGAAAAELQSWLDLCRADPRLRSCLEASGVCEQQQLPQQASALQPCFVDTLRETVAVAHANSSSSRGSGSSRGSRRRTSSVPTSNSGSSGSGSSSGSRAARGAAASGAEVGRSRAYAATALGGAVVGQQAGAAAAAVDEAWLQDYTHMPMLLPGVCDVLGSCLSLQLSCSTAEPGSTWCKEAYCITVQDQHRSRQQHSQGQQLKQSVGQQRSSGGTLWLLFDDSHLGMPATHLVSPGVPLPAVAAADTGAADTSTPQQQQLQDKQQQQGQLCNPALQHPTVVIIFPRSFCSANRGFGGSSNGGSSSRGGSSAFGVLQSLLHELGHALHFLLSASSAAEPAAAAAGGHQCSLEVMEATSHLLERMTRSATCLRAMLRHRVTQQPPPQALLQQLLMYNGISSRGAYQWHQHVLAALTDSELAAAAAQQGLEPNANTSSSISSVRCCEVLQAVTHKYSPLAPQQRAQDLARGPQQQQQQLELETLFVSSAMLEHLPAMVVLQPGDMYCYICADLVAAALWERDLQRDPLNPEAWGVLRRGLFEAGGQHSTVEVFEGLLGVGSMQQLSVQLGQQEVAGWVPDLAHPCFQDIDLWA